jgi:glycosyltransferase involved in cell wall biosynthesis
MRVLMATPRYSPFVGGVESHVYQVARRLVQDVNVTVLTTDPSGQLPTRERIDGVAIQRVRAWPADRDYYLAPDLYSIIRQGDWDIVHVQSYHTFVAPLAMTAAWRAHVPYVVTFHGGGHSSRLRHTLRRAQWAMLRPLLAHAEKLVAVAKFEIEFYRKQLHLPPEKFVLIPNGSDLPKTAAISPIEHPGILIASVGRLERYKGHQRVIAALPFILKQQPDVRLWIAGEGPYEADLRRLAAKLEVADRVEIRAIPSHCREAMAAELSKAALFVLLSEYETHPIAALEAIALGCPALVADTSGLSELSENGLARAIPLNSTPAQIATAMLEQIRQSHLPKTFNLPTWDDCAASLLALYQTLV